MIFAKEIKTGKVLSFTEKDWYNTQLHFGKEWEQIEVKADVSTQVTNDIDLVIEIIAPNTEMEEVDATEKEVEQTNESYIESMKSTYPKGWSLKKQFIDQNGVIFEKGKLIAKQV